MACMFLKCFATARRFYSLSISKRNTMDIEKCYFRYIQSENKVDITFLFKVKDSLRQFNLSRSPEEKLETLINRLANNVQRAVDKGNKKKKKNNSQLKETELEARIVKGDNIPINSDLTCLELFETGGSCKLIIHDHEYKLSFNMPWVINVSIPDTILAGFPIYPDHLKTMYATEENTLFKWYCAKVGEKEKKSDQAHWELVGTELSYTPSVKDIGKKLKLECLPGNNEVQGPTVEVISTNEIQAGPGSCPFETRHQFTTKKLKDRSFRCVSYNILADLYCDSEFTRTVLHPYCPHYALNIDYRKQLVLKELLGYNADIINLQEVDKKIFNHYLAPHLKSEGYDGLFYQKGKEVAEGLACFYRTERFQSIGQSRIWLTDVPKEKCLEPIWNVIKDNEPLVKRLLDRSTVASATFLQSKDNPDEIIVVGNTHLYFHPDADHIRLLQGGMVLYWLQHLKNELQEKNQDKNISLMISGDFNSVPSCGVYELYTKGHVSQTNSDWQSNLNEAVVNLELTNKTLLSSACGTPEYTNFTAEFADCLDYIYYEKDKFIVEQVVPFPSNEELKAHIALPSIVFPSDHLALIADLQFKLQNGC